MNESLKINVIFVDPDGTATIDGRRMRISVGNPFVEGSLYSEEPALVPWVTKFMADSVAYIEALNDAQTASLLKERMKACRDRESLNVTPFPAVHARLFTPARYKGLAGGRASTKSVSTVDYLLLKGIESPVSYLCARETFVSIGDTVRETMGNRLEALGLESFYTVLQTEIRGANGSRFSFKGIKRDPEAIKSMHGFDGAWIEEAQKLTAASFDKLLPTFREAGAEIIFTFNRESNDYPVDRHFFGDGSESIDKTLIESTYMDNPWLAWDLSREILRDKQRDPQKYAHVWGGGVAMRADAAVLRHWRIGDLDDEVEASDSIVPIYGLDIGHTNPSAFVEAFILPPEKEGGVRRLYVSDERYQHRVELDDLMSFMYGDDHETPPRWSNRQAFGGVDEAIHYPVIVDSSRPDVIVKLKEHGAQAYGSRKGAGSVERGIRALNNFDMIVHPSCENFIREATHYAYKVDPHTDIPTETLIDENNHLVDALRYAVQSEERNVMPGRRF